MVRHGPRHHPFPTVPRVETPDMRYPRRPGGDTPSYAEGRAVADVVRENVVPRTVSPSVDVSSSAGQQGSTVGIAAALVFQVMSMMRPLSLSLSPLSRFSCALGVSELTREANSRRRNHHRHNCLFPEAQETSRPREPARRAEGPEHSLLRPARHLGPERPRHRPGQPCSAHVPRRAQVGIDKICRPGSSSTHVRIHAHGRVHEGGIRHGRRRQRRWNPEARRLPPLPLRDVFNNKRRQRRCKRAHEPARRRPRRRATVGITLDAQPALARRRPSVEQPARDTRPSRDSPRPPRAALAELHGRAADAVAVCPVGTTDANVGGALPRAAEREEHGELHDGRRQVIDTGFDSGQCDVSVAAPACACSQASHVWREQEQGECDQCTRSMDDHDAA